MEVEEDGSLFSEEKEREMEVEGDCSQWHHLIFCEELKNNDDQKKNHVPVCSVCYEALVLGGPAYKCLECNFLQHKSCPESPYTESVVTDHKYWWKRHHLIDVEELDNTGNEEVACPGCQEPVFGPAYKCSIPNCTFCLHKSCSEQLSHVIQHPLLHPEHSLILQAPSDYDICYACGKYCGRSLFYRCFLCDFNLDVICASRWRTDADNCHQHSFVPISAQIQFACQACGEEEPKQFACLCTICRLLIHSTCARYPRTIKTNTHDHSLTLTYSLSQEVKNQDKVLCELCRKKMKTEYSAYYCQKCGYISHLNCAHWVQENSSVTTELVASNSVGYESHLVHLVEGIDILGDERAGPLEINHFSHPQHNLILSDEKPVDVKRCEACIQYIISTPFYGCAQCNFFLHYRCAKLPATIKRGIFHEHPLTLLSHDVNPSGLFWCNACKRDHDGFVYGCDKCKWYKLDVKCCLIPEIIEHEGHQHSLYLLAIESSKTCNGCGKKGVNFRCPHCDEFTLCFRCATLPLVARYEYDTHLLKLSYTREEESDEEYYCLICEEERKHPDHWFYSCVRCKFTAHSRCVLGENPCINYGRTFTDKDHKHPLTIVQKTKHSPPCDRCGGFFYDVALECTKCKFYIHKYCL